MIHRLTCFREIQIMMMKMNSLTRQKWNGGKSALNESSGSVSRYSLASGKVSCSVSLLDVQLLVPRVKLWKKIPFINVALWILLLLFYKFCPERGANSEGRGNDSVCLKYRTECSFLIWIFQFYNVPSLCYRRRKIKRRRRRRKLVKTANSWN